MSLYHPRPERWPQVSLRGLLVVVTLAAAVCWVGVQVKWIRDRHTLLNRLHPAAVSIAADPPRLAPPSIRLLGEQGYVEIAIRVLNLGHPTREDEDLKRQTERLFPEARVGFQPYWIRGQIGGI